MRSRYANLRRFANDGQKRYDDTVLIGYEYAVEGVDSDRAHASIRRLNQIHGHYGIPNHEFRYLLATTLVGPVRFIEKYGWRPMHPHEVAAMTKVTGRLGQLMGIKDNPYRHDASRTYPFGYTISDLGPRDVSAELHAHAPDSLHLHDAPRKGA
ncbi:MAG: hypothetical protein JWR52_3546 [Marmoricola sp.]|nr:hypothetical protein [Marmoricola sp.]